MLKKNIISVALSGLLFSSPLVMAVEEHHPENADEVTQDAPSMEKAPGDAAVATSGMMGAGMMKGGPAMMGNRSGMMRQMMMGGQQGGGGMMQGGPGMMMGQGGNKVMAQGGMMSQGMKGGHGKGMMGHGMMRKHRQVVNRLDLIDARLAKIETMLERLMQR